MDHGSEIEPAAAECFLALDRELRVVFVAAPGASRPLPHIGQHLHELYPASEAQAWCVYESSLGGAAARRFEGLCPLTHTRREIHVYPNGAGLSIFTRAIGAVEARGSAVRPSFIDADAEQPAQAIASPADDWSRSLSSLVGSLPDGVYLLDASGVRAVNQAAASLLGYARPEDVPHELSTLARELNLRQRDSRVPLLLEQQPLYRAIHGEPNVQELLLRPHHGDEERVVRYAAAPILAAGRQVGALAVGSVVSAAATDAVVDQRRAEFEQHLVGIVSHDLRNPLQVIRFAALLGLKAAAEDARQVRQFERILTSCARALRMIDDLSDFTRIRFAGGLSVERSEIDLHALTEQVVAELLTTRPGRQVDVVASGDGLGMWDADRLAQVLQNLIGNALQHTTEETPVRVTTRGEEDGVVLEVHNGGPPIAAEDQARLFEPFRRGSGAKGAGGRSLGLGLHITAHLVEAHNGSLRLESSAEHGTTFRVWLPRARAPEKA